MARTIAPWLMLLVSVVVHRPAHAQLLEDFGPEAEAGYEVSDGLDISDEEIERALDGHGHWQEDVEHGWVWRPRDVNADWVPYSRGTWREGPGGRWVWVSDFAWGRVAFHYGRWFDHPWLGWVWVPGYVYAPSWVLMRTSDAWLSWAPLPPGPCYRGSTFVGVVPRHAWSYAPRARRVVVVRPGGHPPPRSVRWVVSPRPRWHRSPPPAHRHFIPQRPARAVVHRPPLIVERPRREVRVERPRREVRVERPRREVRVQRPRREVRVERPRREVRVQRHRQEVRVHRPRREVRVERPQREVRVQRPRREVRGERPRHEVRRTPPVRTPRGRGNVRER